jgi:hypothetical protein
MCSLRDAWLLACGLSVAVTGCGNDSKPQTSGSSANTGSAGAGVAGPLAGTAAVGGSGAAAAGAPSPVAAAGSGGRAPATAGVGAAAGRGAAAGSLSSIPIDVDAGPVDDVPVSRPGSFKLFDQIPQFGMYGTTEPDFDPPSGVLMWHFGTEFVRKLSPEQQAQIGADLTARVTFHAQCDNYDRLGGVFSIAVPPGQTPKPSDPRTELVRFITPFSDYTRGALATYAFAPADLSAYARALADASHDVWIGIGGGSNPYADDPCERNGQPAAFNAIGFKYSLELSSTTSLAPGKGTTLTALYNLAAKMVPVTGTFDVDSASVTGQITVIISGHGAESGGDEYRNTQDTLSLAGTALGTFSTMIDCAPYARFSPDGNPGIFSGNNARNPRNWCPGALVPSHTFPASLRQGANRVSLAIDPSDVPSGSYYATSIAFTSP